MSVHADSNGQTNPSKPYWNPIEVLPRSELRRIQLQRLKQITNYVYENSIFYRELFIKKGIGPDDLRSLRDLQKFPLTFSSMVKENQERHPPYGNLWCVSPGMCGKVFLTSGSTGTPKKFFYTTNEWYTYSVETAARAAWAIGIRPGDIEALCFSFGPFGGPHAILDGLDKVGAVPLPLGGFSTSARLRIMQDIKVKGWSGTPSYAFYMAEVAKREGMDLSKFGIEKIWLAGEIGGSIPSTRRRLEQLWNSKVYDGYGLTDFTFFIAYECTEQAGMHLLEDMVLCEFIDPDTLHDEAPEEVSPGENGVLVLTKLVGEAAPWVRYVTNDIAIKTDDNCPCGRTSDLIIGGIVGRADDMVKVKGVSLFPSAVEELVRSYPELSEEFQAIVDKVQGTDTLTLKVEPKEGVSESEYQQVLPKLADEFRTRFHVSARIQLVPPAALPRTEYKAKRLIDNRVQ